MKAPSPACFATWQEYDVRAHTEWAKRNAILCATVQLFGSSWGYLITRRTDVSHEVLEGKFDWDWTAMDACAKAETAWAKAIAKEGEAT